jgi:hypothetical protein
MCSVGSFNEDSERHNIFCTRYTVSCHIAAFSTLGAYPRAPSDITEDSSFNDAAFFANLCFSVF